MGSSRTEAQTLMAGFYSANPLGFYNAGLRVIAMNQGLVHERTSASLCQDEHGRSGCARPAASTTRNSGTPGGQLTAIHEAAYDGNPLTSPDPELDCRSSPSPGYPDEPSGYNCYTGGFWQSARYFFGTDKFEFSLTSPRRAGQCRSRKPRGSARVYQEPTSGSGDVIDDTINGRILNGFHFRTADVHGAWIGKKTAQWIDKHYFGPAD